MNARLQIWNTTYRLFPRKKKKKHIDCCFPSRLANSIRPFDRFWLTRASTTPFPTSNHHHNEHAALTLVLVDTMALTAKRTTRMAKGGATALCLSGDAIFDILSWTPVKSVCRFRCVSKEWLALISDPVFIAKHKSRAAPEPCLVASFYEGRADTDSGLLVTDMKGNVVRVIRGLDRFPLVHSSLDNLVSVSSYDLATRVVDVVTGKVLLTIPQPSTQPWHRAFIIVLGRAAVCLSPVAAKWCASSNIP
jgi:hypothetical protein